MKTINFREVNKIYDCSNQLQVEVHKTHHPQFKDFCFSLRDFIKTLEDNYDDDHWSLFVRTLKLFRYELSSAPLPFNYSGLTNLETFDQIKKNIKLTKYVYPDLADQAEDLLAKYQEITTCPDNPLFEMLKQIYASNLHDSMVLLIKETKLIPFVEEFLKSAGLNEKLSVVSPSQLKKDQCYSMIIYIGSPKLLPNYIFSAPRARNISIIQYDWMNEQWKPASAFLAPASYSNNSEDKQSSPPSVQPGHSTDYLDVSDLVETNSWDKIATKFGMSNNKHNNYDEDIAEAKLFILEGDLAVFLDASMEDRQMVIDLEEDPSAKQYKFSRVKKIFTKLIEPGMFLLVRTSGGGDYISIIANKLMGDKATGLRKDQQQWKSLLKTVVKQEGVNWCCHELMARGSIIANEVNLRNWVSARLIRPQSDVDFKAILNLVGLGEKANQYIQSAGTINSFHLRAGVQLRKQLLQIVLGTDLTDLEKLGRMDFYLPDGFGGCFTAIRVVEISRQKFIVPVSKLEHPFDRGASTWQK